MRLDKSPIFRILRPSPSAGGRNRSGLLARSGSGARAVRFTGPCGPGGFCKHVCAPLAQAIDAEESARLFLIVYRKKTLVIRPSGTTTGLRLSSLGIGESFQESSMEVRNARHKEIAASGPSSPAPKKLQTGDAGPDPLFEPPRVSRGRFRAPAGTAR